MNRAGRGISPTASAGGVRPASFCRCACCRACSAAIPGELIAVHQAGHLKFFGGHAALADAQAFAAYLAPLRRAEWVVYAKRPFGGQAVLAYLSRYTTASPSPTAG